MDEAKSWDGNLTIDKTERSTNDGGGGKGRLLRPSESMSSRMTGRPGCYCLAERKLNEGQGTEATVMMLRHY